MIHPKDLKDRVAALEYAAPNVPPIFHHLFSYLPKPGEDFPRDKQIAFLRALDAVTVVAYGGEPLNIDAAAGAREAAGQRGK